MNYKSRLGAILLFVFFAIYLFFWIFLNLFIPHDNELFNYFSDTYGIAAALGGVFGFIAAKKWGGFSSLMGKTISFFSIGLFFQFLGQVSYAFYFYILHIENAYPSLGDFFYFGSIPLYCLAITYLYKVLKIEITLHSNLKKFIALLIPLLFISVSYYVFLKDYEVDPNALMVTVLDFAYPFGGATFLGLTLIAYLFSTSTLGGKLKKYIIVLFIALVTQYLADTLYLVHTIRETWRAGGIDDLFYLSAYVVLGLTLISFGHATEELVTQKKEINNG